jgi:hypothetical protein
VIRSDAARAITREIGRTWRRVRPIFFRQVTFLSSERKRREHNMRLFLSLASVRLGSRHLMLGTETLLALTLCLSVVRLVMQL